MAIETLCDFCHRPDPTFWHLTTAFVVTVTNKTIDSEEGGNWAACTNCDALLDAGDAAGLTQAYALAETMRGHRVTSRAMQGVATFHRAVVAHLQPGKIPL